MPFALRVVVSVALLGVVLSQVEWSGVRDALTRADLAWLGIAFVSFNGAMVLAAQRWQTIVSADRHSRPRLGAGAALKATYVSLWLSNFLPTAFGGDVARVLAARRAGARLPVALSSAVLDRYLGLTTLAFLFLLFEVLRAAATDASPLMPIAIALAAGSGVLLVAILGASYLTIGRRWLRNRGVRFVVRATRLLRDLAANREAMALVLAASVVGTLLGTAAYWGAIRCMTTAVSFPAALAVATVGTVASALPISLSGWGVREGAVAVTLTQSMALSSGDASLVAILNGIVIGVTSLIGFALTLMAGLDRRAVDSGVGS
jgi:uncharacterized protein (TIRG00374 family)